MIDPHRDHFEPIHILVDGSRDLEVDGDTTHEVEACFIVDYSTVDMMPGDWPKDVVLTGSPLTV